jgi:glycosyltransferase involved in cell wall biosynthesis
MAAELYGIPPARIAVVPEPIDLGEWRRRVAAAERRVSSRPTVLSVARMYPRKRLADLLRAAVILRSRIPDVQVRIVGEGPASDELRRLHAELRLADTVVLLGEVSRAGLSVEYVSADCFCLPTIQEGFGLVFAEAMAAGLPVVACRAAAVPEIVVDGLTGMLVTPERPDELAAAMETVLMNHGLRKELADQARRRVEAYDLDRVAGAFMEALPS